MRSGFAAFRAVRLGLTVMTNSSRRLRLWTSEAQPPKTSKEVSR
jgi:hypothetical protein